MQNILDSWPHPDKAIRAKQEASLEWAAEQSAKYLILQAPVGSGKSLIGMTLSRYLSMDGRGSSYLLTPQKVLQKQYETSFSNDHVVSLYGKQNFSCQGKGTTCDIGSVVKPKCQGCPYTAAMQLAMQEPNLVLNYKLALLLFSYHPKFGEGSPKRKLMVLDECHVLEQHLVDFDAIEISRRFVEGKLGMKWKIMRTMPEVVEWVTLEYYDKLQSYFGTLESQILPILAGTRKPSAADVKLVKHYNSVGDHLAEMEFITHTPLDTLAANRVLIKEPIAYRFKSIYGRGNFKIIDGRAERYLFMSGTVDRDGFCRDVGIPPEDAAFFSVDSEIPVTNRPVHFIPVMRVNAEWDKPERKDDRENLITTIKTIIDLHENDSGVIHTGNFKLAEWVVSQLGSHAKANGIKLVHHNPSEEESGDRNHAIEDYMTVAGSGKRAILISPSVTEGLDLAEDLGRFSITVKVPFGNLGDDWIKTRMELSGEWYRRQAVYHVLQASGRVVRSSTDKGSTYILDENWQRLMNSSLKLIPEWWRDAYHE